jgi:nitrile hydratase beta subunit
MDGIHDLGGKQGYGPIDTVQGDPAFHHDWERRMWALARSGIAQGITIDWFRHGLERMVPTDYLSFVYLNKWCTNYLMLLIDNGAVTLDEVNAGHVERPGDRAAPKSLDDILAANRAGCRSFAAEPVGPARFSVGDAVLTHRLMHDGHTRLPAYARSARGRVIAHHGGHLFADDGARGIERGEHLYTIAFAAPELWGEGADPRDQVMLDLWESYLVPA